MNHVHRQQFPADEFGRESQEPRASDRVGPEAYDDVAFHELCRDQTFIGQIGGIALVTASAAGFLIYLHHLDRQSDFPSEMLDSSLSYPAIAMAIIALSLLNAVNAYFRPRFGRIPCFVFAGLTTLAFPIGSYYGCWAIRALVRSPELFVGERLRPREIRREKRRREKLVKRDQQEYFDFEEALGLYCRRRGSTTG